MEKNSVKKLIGESNLSWNSIVSKFRKKKNIQQSKLETSPEPVNAPTKSRSPAKKEEELLIGETSENLFLKNTINDEITVIVPAFNEEEHIEKALKPLIEWKTANPEKRHIAIVDDGSKDKTVEIAKNLGVEVIYSNPQTYENMGKATAFFEGAKYAERNGSKFFVTLDADLFNFSPVHVDGLVDLLKNGKYNMVVGYNREGGKWIDGRSDLFYNRLGYFLSGQRAFRLQALTPLLNKNPKWLSLMQGYGLELALNHLIPKRAFTRKIIFDTLLPFRGDKERKEFQIKQLDKAELLIARRKALAKRLKEMKAMEKREDAQQLRDRINRVYKKIARKF